MHELEKRGTVESETFIANVMQHLPNTYHEGLARRSQQARRRLYVYRELERALQEPCVEAEVVRAWEQLGQIRGRVMVSPEMKARAELAEARLPLLQAFQAIPESASEAEREQRVLEIWNDALLGGCTEAAAWLPVYLKAQAWQETVRKLQAAVQAEDAETIERLMQAPAAQAHELPAELGASVRELRWKAQQATAAKRQAVVNTLLENSRSGFAQLFDAATIADICRQFRHHQPLVNQWMESEILPIERLGLTADPEQAVRRDEQGEWHIVWTWPPPQVSNECRLAIVKKRPAALAQPDDVQAEHAAVIRRQDWNPEAGYVVPANPEWDGAWVYVWVVVDLGYQLFFSPPFEVGQLAAAGGGEEAVEPIPFLALGEGRQGSPRIPRIRRVRRAAAAGAGRPTAARKRQSPRRNRLPRRLSEKDAPPNLPPS